MAVISIVGTSGVGKSFLVKQLSAITQNPAFFEGEEGTIPEEILENIFNGGSPIKRWNFFINRRKKALKRAMKISKQLDIDCYVDGAMLTTQAINKIESKKYQKILDEMLEDYLHLKSDFTFLLTCNQKCLESFISLRKRNSEASKKAIFRALKLQDIFIELAKQQNLTIIDRSDLDFKKEKDMNYILRIIRSSTNH